MVSGSFDRTFRVWDVESGETDARMIATGGNYGLKIWDARSGELLKTIRDRCCACLAWTSDGKTIFAGRFKIDTATWRVALNTGHRNLPYTISLSPNERILASTSYLYKTAQLWNSETDQPIGTPLHHANNVRSAIFSADGKLLVTSCNDGCLYTWDVLAIIKEAGFFDDVRDANSPPLHRRILSTFSSSLYHSRPHEATKHNTQSRPRPFSWSRNLCGMLRRRDRSDIELQEVPYTARPPPRNHDAEEQPATRSSQPHTTQSNVATQSTAPTTGTISRPRVTISGWRAHLVGWLCCVPIQNTNDQP